MFEPKGTDNFNPQVLQEKTPVLLAHIRRDYHYMEQVNIFKRVSKEYETRLNLFLFNEDFEGTFKKYGIYGSPAFVIFHQGKEKGRMLGKADKDELNKFISGILSNLPTSHEIESGSNSHHNP